MNKILTLVGLTLSLSANAALYDRGNGMIYDDTLDITWLQDANYAQTSGYDSDGKMTWADANTWAAGLNYGGYDDWHLPSVGNAPTTGYYVTSGELGQMFYNNLGNSPGSSILNNISFNDQVSGGTELFLNVQSYVYWYSEDYSSRTDLAWAFSTGSGNQSRYGKVTDRYSWAVRSGDVNAVPVPAAAWLFGSAVIGLAGIKRKK